MTGYGEIALVSMGQNRSIAGETLKGPIERPE